MTTQNDKRVDKRVSTMLSLVNRGTIEPDKQLLDMLRELSASEFAANSARGSKKLGKTINISKWRTIMKSKITKLAVAAVVIFTALLSFFNIGVKKTYAVGQTIEAMRKVNTVHCFMTTFTGERIETWIKVNPETGENEYYYMGRPEMKIIATPDETYMYNESQNVVVHLKGSGHFVSQVRFGRFVEDMVDSAKSVNGKVQIRSLDVEGEKPMIMLIIETDKMTLESRIDSETKLPVSMNMKLQGKPQPGQIGQSIDEMSYDEPLPDGIFDFEIPEGAKVIEQ